MSETTNELDDIRQLREVFQKLQTAEPIPTVLDADAAFMLVCQLQLALRHPLNNGYGSEVIRRMAGQLEEALAEQVPEAVVQLEKGWQPELDITVKPEVSYLDLPLIDKGGIIANSMALQIAGKALEELSGKSQVDWVMEILLAANEAVNQMSDEEVEAHIERLVEIREMAANES